MSNTALHPLLLILHSWHTWSDIIKHNDPNFKPVLYSPQDSDTSFNLDELLKDSADLNPDPYYFALNGNDIKIVGDSVEYNFSDIFSKLV